MEMTTIKSKEYRDLIERAYAYGFYADRAEELESELLEIKSAYNKVLDWFADQTYYHDCYADWLKEHGLDPQAAEIERLTGENEELRRGIDELGAQVEYWRLKAGVDDGKMD